jgi:hypothetical protein
LNREATLPLLHVWLSNHRTSANQVWAREYWNNGWNIANSANISKPASNNVTGDFECPLLRERCCKNRVDSIEILSFNGFKSLSQAD